ncbi:hypothetical protein BGZ90_004006 [Linnemannia elongata]|nr:hypothetical protein BGZ90_004006 [Linnemannia elongata]
MAAKVFSIPRPLNSFLYLDLNNTLYPETLASLTLPPSTSIISPEKDIINDLARTLAKVLKPQNLEPYTSIVDTEACLNFMDSFEEFYTILRLHERHWVAYIVLSLNRVARSKSLTTHS